MSIGLKKVISIWIIIFYLLSIFSGVSAKTSDYSGHWASSVIEKWISKGLINPQPDGNVKPDETIKKIEFITFINKIFNFSKKESVSFLDVVEGTWYGDEIAKAIAAGYIQDDKKGRMYPFNPINRLDAVVMLSKAFELKVVNRNTVNNFSDADRIPASARDAVSAMAERNYVKAISGNRFLPGATLTRADAVTMIDGIMGQLFNKSGTYKESIQGNLVINTKSVILRNMKVEGNLYLTEGIDNGDVTLENVVVNGDTYIHGGGENSIILRNSIFKGNITILKKNGKIRVAAEGSTNVPLVLLRSGATLEGNTNSGYGFREIEISEDVEAGQGIQLKGSFIKVVDKASGSILQVSGSMDCFEVKGTADNSSISFGAGAINELSVGASKANINLTNTKVTTLKLNDTASATKLKIEGAVIGFLDVFANASIEIDKSTLDRLDIEKKAEGTSVQTNFETSVKVLNAYAGTTIKGWAVIETANINAANVNIDTTPKYVNVISGIRSSIGGAVSSIKIVTNNMSITKNTPVQSLVVTDPADVTLSYSSGNKDVASVNPITGFITGISSGIAIINVTATKAGYNIGTASFPVSVVDMTNVEGNAAGDSTVTMTAPSDTDVSPSDNTWTINVTGGTVRSAVSASDLVITGLPAGLTASASKGTGNSIVITISGTLPAPLTSVADVNVVVKGNAVVELGAEDSSPITVTVVPGVQVTGTATDDSVTLIAPAYTAVDASDNKWLLNISSGTVKSNVSANDLIITGLPSGLTPTAAKGTGNTIIITVAGTASSAVLVSTSVSVVVKGSAVTEPLAIDSIPISVTVVTGSLKIVGDSASDSTVTMTAPANTLVDASDNTWTLNVTTGTVKAGVNVNDLTITGLPAGLTAAAANGTGNTITVSVTGTAAPALTMDESVSIVLKSSAVTEPITTDSDPIVVVIKAGTQVAGDAIGNSTVSLTGPGQIAVSTSDDTWTINVTTGTLKSGIGNGDVTITGLPSGLNATVVQGTGNSILITISGATAAPLVGIVSVDVVVKGTAVTEVAAVDSAPIPVTVNPGVFQITANAVGDSTASMIAPAQTAVNPADYGWILNVTTGTVKSGVNENDLTIIGLPSGLTATAVKGTGNTIEVTLTGTASTPLISAANVNVVVKSTAVTEAGSTDSAAVGVTVIPGTKVAGTAIDSTITMVAPAQTDVSAGDNTLVFNITSGTVSPGFGSGDVDVVGLPAGLSVSAAKGAGNTVVVTASGTAAPAVPMDTSVNVIIKGTGMTELGVTDSDLIPVNIKTGIFKLSGNATGDSTVTMVAPAQTSVNPADNTWTLNVTTGTVRAGVNQNDLTFSGLPAGLTAVATNGAGNSIVVTVSGTAAPAISSIAYLYVVIKGSAVIEPAAIDSASIVLTVVPGTQIVASATDSAVTMTAPTQTAISPSDNAWTISLSGGTVKPGVTASDLNITGIPLGLTAAAAKGTGNTIVVTLSGTAAPALSGIVNVGIVVTSSAVTEAYATDSGIITVNINPGAFQITANASGDSSVSMLAPGNTLIDGVDNTWTLNVTAGTVNPGVSLSDLTITGLPAGLNAAAAIGPGNAIVITVSGTAGAPVLTTANVSVIVKASAVIEAGGTNSPVIGVIVSPGAFQIAGNATDSTVTMIAPAQTAVDPADNSWVLDLTAGTVKASLSSSDLVVSGLPAGLNIAAVKGPGNSIIITVTGTAAPAIAVPATVNIGIKSSAVIEPAATDSAAISVNIVPGIFKIAGAASDSTVTMMATAQTAVSTADNTWTLSITNGTVKAGVSESDLTVTGLPLGLNAAAANGAGNTIVITVSGAAAPAVPVTANVNIVVKASAVTEGGAVDSIAIPVTVVPGIQIAVTAADSAVTMIGPAQTTLSSSDNTWTLNITTGTLKSDVGNSDLTITGLPAGLTASAAKGTGNTIILTVSGTAGTPLPGQASVNIIVKASSVTEAGAANSNSIPVTVDPGQFQVTGNATGNSTATMEAPAQTSVSLSDNTWTLTVVTGTVRPGVSASDLSITGLPSGLMVNAVKGTGNTIDVTVTGTADTPVSSTVNIDIAVKGSAVVEAGGTDSSAIGITLIPGIQIAGSTTDSSVTMAAPGQSVVSLSDNTWAINVTSGTVKGSVSSGDLTITGLPAGLSTAVTKGTGNTIVITVSGTAAPALMGNAAVDVVIKGSAVTEIGATDSAAILVHVNLGSFQITANATGNNTVTMIAPGQTNISGSDSSWTLNVTAGTVKDGVTESDLTITGLPAGLSATAVKGTGNTIDVTVGGIAGAPLSGPVSINIVIKASAVVETSATDSAAIAVTVNPGQFQVAGNAAGNSTVTLTAPYNTNVDPTDNTWTLNVTSGTLKAGVTESDLTLTGLPAGLTASAVKGGGNIIVITVSGTASPSLASTAAVNIVIKGSAVTEAGATDSAAIAVTVKVLGIMGVGVDIAAGKVTNTLTNMQYSLDSTNGTNGTWVDCSTPSTSVSFIAGKVYVREKAQPSNYNLVATVTYEPSPDISGVSIDIAGGTISSTTDTMQYRLNGGVWTNVTAGGNTAGITFIPGEVEFRTAATTSTLASLPVKLVTILGQGAPPSLLYDDVANTVTGLDATYEYKIDTGSWTSGDVPIADLNGTKTVQVRLKATANALASQIQTINFTPNLSLIGVNISIAVGMITGTTNTMQYSFDSTNGTNGAWTDCSNTNTTVIFVAGKVYIRAKAQPTNYRLVATIAPAAAAPDVTGVSFDIAAGTLTGTSDTMQYRVNGGTWAKVTQGGTTSGVVFTTGDLEFRTAATSSTLPSQVAAKATILAPAAAPNLVYDDVANTISGMDATYEYKIDTGAWTSGDLSGDFSGTRTVQVRLKATSITLFSQIQTIYFTANVGLNAVGMDIAAGVLVGTDTTMQVSLNSTDGLSGTWADCTNTNTSVTFVAGRIYIRAKAQPANYKLVGTIVPAALPPDVTGITFNIVAGTITGTLDTMEYRINAGTWTGVIAGGTMSGVAFSAGDLEFRIKATKTLLPSQAALKTTILASAVSPSLVYDDVANTITGLDTTYEYNIESNGWVSGNIPIADLSGDKIVQIRLKATASALASQNQTIHFTTNLALSGVGINVASGLITGTSTSMQYSLDSTDGNDGIWIDCTVNTTPVTFAAGKVYVRSKTQPANYRLVATIALAAAPPALVCDDAANTITGLDAAYEYKVNAGAWTSGDIPGDFSGTKTIQVRIKATVGALASQAQVIYFTVNVNLSAVGIDVAAGKITNTVSGIEYSLNSTNGTDGTWSDCTASNTAVTFAAGKVYVREKANPANFQWVATIALPAAAPNLAFDDVANTITGLDVTYEYMIGTGAWFSGDIAGDFSGTGNVWVRKKATVSALPSQSQGIYFTVNLDLSGVGVNVAAGTLTATATTMQYSLDSTNGTNGTWHDCLASTTIGVTYTGGVKVYVRADAQPLNYRLVASIPAAAAAPDLTGITYNVAYGTITGTLDTMQYRLNGSVWNNVSQGGTTTGITFIAGDVDFRIKATASALPSQFATKGTIALAAAAPALVSDDVANTITGLDNTYEYKIGTGSWVSGDVVGDFSGTKTVQVRKKATAIALASQIQTADFTLNFDLTAVSVDVAAGKITNTAVGMEYSLDSTNGTDGAWSDCTTSNTTVSFVAGKVYVRAKSQPMNFRLAATVAVPVADLTGVAYDIAAGTITGTIDTMQYRMNGSTWTDVTAGGTTSNVMFIAGDLEFRLVATVSALASQPAFMATLSPAGQAPSLAYDDFTDTITGLNATFEYKIGTGSWTSGNIAGDFSGTKTVQIRRKATAADLPSMIQTVNFTAALDLSAIGVNVVAGKITGTASTMQYSLDCTDGVNGTWADCTDLNTTAAFVPGKVYVRAKAQPQNYRLIVTIGASAAAPDITGVGYNIAAGTVTGTLNTMQYRLNGGMWQNVTAGGTTNGITFVAGALEFRIKATSTTLASQAAIKATIPPVGDAPNLIYDDLANTIPGLTGNMEYKIGSGVWLTGDPAADFSGTITVSVRWKATAAELASQIQTINFTANVGLSNVGVNIAAGIITGTDTTMQYSLDSTDGINGTWTDCATTNTAVNFVPGKVYVRAKLQPANNRTVTTVAASTAAPSLAGISYNVVGGTITGTADTMQYRMNGGVWQNVMPGGTTDNLSFTAGDLEFRIKATSTALASLSAVKATIPTADAEPSLTYDDLSNTIPNINSGYEYKINSGSWMTGDPVVDFSGTITVSIRWKATATELASQIQTINFTANVGLTGVGVNIAGGIITGTDSTMQYSLDSTNGLNGTWTDCTAPTTQVVFDAGNVYIRAKAQPSNYRKVTSVPVASPVSPPDLSGVSYNVAAGTINTGITANLQYRIGGETWSNIDAGITSSIAFVPGDLEFRIRPTTTALASQSAVKGTIAPAGDVPNLVYDDLANTITGLNSTFEYRINNGLWITGAPGVDFSGSIAVDVRWKGTTTELPSLIQSINFTANVGLTGVGIDIYKGLMTGTDTTMQYSFDSTNGLNGTWTDCTATNTSVTFVPGDVYVRAKAQPVNFRKVTSVSIAPPAGIPSVTAVGTQNAITLIGADTTMEYSRDGGITWRLVTASIADGIRTIDVSTAPNTDLRVRVAATANTLPSLATAKLN